MKQYPTKRSETEKQQQESRLRNAVPQNPFATEIVSLTSEPTTSTSLFFLSPPSLSQRDTRCAINYKILFLLRWWPDSDSDRDRKQDRDMGQTQRK